MAILKESQIIGNYTVQSFIKEGLYNETYRISDKEGAPYFLKIFDPTRIPYDIKDKDGQILEITLSRKLAHRNVIQYVNDDIYEMSNTKYPYIVTQYFTGILVAEPLVRGRIFPLERALNITINALKGLIYMHSKGLLHNDITPRNIMFNPKQLEETQLIDLGHISEYNGSGNNFLRTDLIAFYRAPETYSNQFDYRSDIYSIIAVLYSMVFGKEPWGQQLPEGLDANEEEKRVRTLMNKPLSFSGSLDGCPLWLQQLFKICLSPDPEKRIQTAKDLLNALETKTCPNIYRSDKEDQKVIKSGVKSEREAEPQSEYSIQKKVGNGFADVAGMDDVKAMLQQKVIFLLKNPNQAKKYKLTPPNGMLLYGPPGCGKTYFAEKFAEEAQLNYILIKASDIGSTYIHGSQGKIAQLFKDAEKNAPSVICFDEFDAMVPKRSGSDAKSLMNPEVNEFLSQMNNCSQKGIFIIGTTNQKELIDEAVLRKGRLDLHVMIPAPDKDTRKKIFDFYLKDRPCSDIDTNALAALTDNYSSSDIAFIVNDAALVAAFKDTPIEQKMLEESICNNPSSLGQAQLTLAPRRKIGFNVQ